MIPIKNIYYLLSYSWHQLEEGQRMLTSKSDFEDMLNLLAKVLINTSSHLLRRGLDRSYNRHVSSYAGIKGKLLLSPTLRANKHQEGLTVCAYDEFDHDILHNQILKATLWKLLHTKDVELRYRLQIKTLLQRFPKIQSIDVQVKTVNLIRLHRNNQHYSLAMNICRIILENLSLNEDRGQYEFIDFIRDDHKMGKLFEAFLRVFYQKHLTGAKVKSEKIKWQAKQVLGEISLPNMITDVSIIYPERKLIIDAKFYRSTLQTGPWGNESVHSKNLFQLFSYLKNSKVRPGQVLEGMLLYPTVNRSLQERYLIHNFPVSVATINLDQPWHQIECDLLDLVRPVIN